MKKISTLLWVLMALLALPKAAGAAEVSNTFDFENNPQNWPVGEGVNFADGNLTAPLTVGEVSMTGIDGNQPCRLMKDNNGVTALYVYANASAVGGLKFNAAEGRAITKVEVTMKSGNFDFEATTGTLSGTSWTGNATEVTFNRTGTGNRQMLKIVVTTDAKNEQTVEPATETFDVEAADIAAFNAVEDGKTVKLTLNNARVNGTFNGYYVEDASGATVIKGITLTVGTALNGYIIGKKSTDNDIDYMSYEPKPYEPQLTVTDATTFEATEIALVGTEMTIIEACQQATYARLVTLKDVTISGAGQNKTLTDANGNTMKARDYMGTLSTGFTWPEKASKFTGVVIYYMTGWFIMPIGDNAIVEESSTALFDFHNNNLELTPSEGGASDPAEKQNAGNLGGKKLTKGDVTLTFVNAPTMCTKLNTNSTRGLQLQLIKDGQMRVTAAEGKAITAIHITYNHGTNSSTGADVYNTAWGVDMGGGTLGTLNINKQSWTGNAQSVRFTATGATYVDAIEVETAPANGETIASTFNEYTTEVSTLKDFNDLADGTLVKLNLTNAIVTAGMNNELGNYIQDATAGAHFYCTGFTFNVNDILNGSVYVKKSKQNMGARIAMTEETVTDNINVTADGTYEPLTGTIDELNVADNKCRVVKLSGIAVKGTSATAATITDANGKTIAINNGKTNYFPYIIQESLADINYEKATVIGILFGSNATTNQIMPLSITEDAETGIDSIDNSQLTIHHSQAWLTIDGRMLSGKPTQKGIYIFNGRKIVVK